MKIRGIGGRVYYDIGADPTEASHEVTEPILTTKEPCLRFICIDPEGEHRTGDIAVFVGKPSLKYEQRHTPEGYLMVLEVNPHYEVRYTTDGSEPKENGGIYDGEFSIPGNCKYIRTVTILEGKEVDCKDISVEKSGAGPSLPKIDPEKPLRYCWKTKRSFSDTEETYDELEKLAQFDDLFIKGGNASICEKGNANNYVDYAANIYCTAADFKALIDLVRETSFKNRESIVAFNYKELLFKKGSQFNDWIERCKLDIDWLRKKGEITQ